MIAKYFRQFIVILVIIFNLFIWHRYFDQNKVNDWQTTDAPIVMVDYKIRSTVSREVAAEQDDLLQFLANIFSNYAPTVNDADFVIDNDLRTFADYNIIVSETRKQFLSTVSSLNNADLSNNSAITILSDQSYQSYIELYSNQTYQIYLKTSDDSGPSLDIIINGQEYSAQRVFSGVYKLDNFNVQNYNAAGIKSANSNRKIDEVVFLTGVANFDQKKISRAIGSNVKLSVNGEKISLKIAEKSFAALIVSDGVDLYKTPSDPFSNSLSMSYYSYHNKPFLSSIELSKRSYFKLVQSSGDYIAKYPLIADRFNRYIAYSIFSLLIILLLYYASFHFGTIKKTVGEYPKTLFRVVECRNLRRVNLEMLLLLAAIILFLILNLNSALTSYISPTIILSFAAAGLLLITRFNPGFIHKIIIALFVIFIVSFSDEHIIFANKTVKAIYIFILLFILVSVVREFIGNNKRLR